MRTDGFEVQWTSAGGATRKFVFEPHSDGGYVRIDKEWTGRKWREVGQKRVESVEIEGSVAALGEVKA